MRCIRKESLAISRRKHFFISAQFTSAQISIAQVNLGKWRQTTHKLRRTRCPVFFGWKINLVLRQLLIGQQRFQGWKVGWSDWTLLGGCRRRPHKSDISFKSRCCIFEIIQVKFILFFGTEHMSLIRIQVQRRRKRLYDCTLCRSEECQSIFPESSSQVSFGTLCWSRDR